MRLFLNTSLLSHTVLLGMKTSKYLAKSRNVKTLDYHQVRYFFACERFTFSDSRKSDWIDFCVRAELIMRSKRISWSLS